MARYRRVHGVKYKMYDSIEDCADKAAEVFKQENWTWSVFQLFWRRSSIDRMGKVPDRGEILNMLRDLHRIAKEESQDDFGGGGRLICYKDQYGHEMPSKYQY